MSEKEREAVIILLRPIRWVVIGVVSASLFACASPDKSAYVPAAQMGLQNSEMRRDITRTMTFGRIGNDVSRRGKTPCNIQGIWVFEGACAEVMLKPAGANIALASYKNLGVTIGFGKNNAKGATPFISGDGTGGRDITGKLDGKSFPLYGASCINASGTSEKCPGSALVYFNVINASANEVDFKTFPAIGIKDTHIASMTECQLAGLVRSNATGQFLYALFPDTGAFKNGSMLLKAIKAKLGVLAGTFIVLAVACDSK